MTVINTNVGALTAQAAMSKNNANLESAIERLSTGLRINSAADDAAGSSIANKLESQIRGLNQAIRNASDGQAIIIFSIFEDSKKSRTSSTCALL